MTEVVIWKLFLVLLLGPQPTGAIAPGPSLESMLRRPAPVYVELDVNAMRRVAHETPSVGRALWADTPPEQAYEAAATQLAGMLKTTPADVKRLTESVRHAGLWLFAFGEDEDQLRLSLLLDCGNERDSCRAFCGARRARGSTRYQAMPACPCTPSCSAGAEARGWRNAMARCSSRSTPC